MRGLARRSSAFSVMQPELARGTEANSKINIGLIGCGGRGRWNLDLFHEHGGYNVVAVQDYFQDRVDQAGEKFKLPAGKRYTGLSGYQRLLEAEPRCRGHNQPAVFPSGTTAAAVDAGRHVYQAKPIAVDVPGCTSIADSGKKAAEQARFPRGFPNAREQSVPGSGSEGSCG